MAHFEKTTTTKHSIFYHPVGEQVFVYAKTFGGLENLIGQTTHLCEIVDVMVLENDCYVCSGTRFSIAYKVCIIDSAVTPVTKEAFEINSKNANASKYQSIASYFGSWELYKDENVTEPLKLVKKIQNPDSYGFEETNDLLHIVYPGAYASAIINKDQIGEYAVQKLREHYAQLTYLGYETIGINKDGEKEKGYRFEFIDKGLNFLKYC